jgi:uncharacterized protein (TIGR02421 family)
MIREPSEQETDFGGGGRTSLRHGGVLVSDPRLPFLLVYRQPPDREDAGTARLLAGEASYVAARRGEETEVQRLVRRIAETGSAAHGAFLVLEVWSAKETDSRTFRVRAPVGPAPETIKKLEETLRSMGSLLPGIDVEVEASDERQPPGMDALLSIPESWRHEVLLIGIEVPPVFRNAESGTVYPRFLRRMQRAFSRALRQAVYEFARVQTTCEVTHPLGLGSRTLPGAVWRVDRSLCAIEHAFDLLLLTSPVNGASARSRFEADRSERNPQFHYRLLPMDPDLLKRRLFAIEMEAIDDPALADLFQDKREELDTQLTMLGERESANFRFSSQRLYGTVSDELHAVAIDLLATIPKARRAPGARVDAAGFRDAALAELDWYRHSFPALRTGVDIRPDLVGLMVSEGNLLIGADLQLEPARVAPLIQHEVGTHVLTYVNGRAQPLEQLSLGLAGYDELQEGLAVFSEYLVGGLDRLRMRLLAARVVAARSVEQGAEFVETYRLLRDEHGFSAAGAWDITVRVHQSGGFTRDFIYLRGVLELLRLLRKGVDLESLYVGKIAAKHIAIVEELRYRNILRRPPLSPRFLHAAGARERMDAARRGLTPREMICLETE